jgi:hypothetical protein
MLEIKMSKVGRGEEEGGKDRIGEVGSSEVEGREGGERDDLRKVEGDIGLRRSRMESKEIRERRIAVFGK